MTGLLVLLLAPPAAPICDGVPLTVHHDGSFEWGYTWGCWDGEIGAFA
ncbi:MAG: hypothetical protein GF355_05665, partial [Candidatus Eisenbacteria bacterium]|nr:hypothetical protein [Candidatus Eisenbacteria bacterium]